MKKHCNLKDRKCYVLSSRRSLIAVIVVSLCLLSVTCVQAGDYGPAIDAQSETMRQIMQDFATVQGNITTYWRNMPERERYLRSTANDAVEYFKGQTNRYPNNQDVDFLRSVLNVAGVRNQEEARLVLDQMDRYIQSSYKINALNDQICRASRATGFKLAGCP